ncbi:MAG: hypothetical protein V4621_08035 [Pseudomonadota bacterium]
MPITLPPSYQNAPSRQADITQPMNDLFNVVTQINNGGGVGFVAGVGNGAQVAQQTSRTTPVTINNRCGIIVGNNASLPAQTRASFVVNNNTVGTEDVVVICLRGGPTADTSQFFVTGIGTGSFTITAANLNAVTADTGFPVIHFVVIKSAIT